ncbi:MAG: hypothetical protein HYZ01_03445 [Ignavibacteriales bacterium]|nr:hypothetical protein [Ignavibacteriales bacterium]
MFKKRISSEAKVLINYIYKDYNKRGEWIGANTLRVKFNPAQVDKLSKKYEPWLFIRWQNVIPEHYELTIFGILNCEGSTGDLDLLKRCFEYLKAEFLKNPEMKAIPLLVIKNGLSLDDRVSERLRILLGLLLNGYANTITNVETLVGFPSRFDEFAVEGKTEEYIVRLAEQRYKADKGRYEWNAAKVDLYRIGFWFLLLGVVWLLYLIGIQYLSNQKFVIGMVALWVSFFMFANLFKLAGINNSFVDPKKSAEKLKWLLLSAVISALGSWLVI